MSYVMCLLCACYVLLLLCIFVFFKLVTSPVKGRDNQTVIFRSNQTTEALFSFATWAKKLATNQPKPKSRTSTENFPQGTKHGGFFGPQHVYNTQVAPSHWRSDERNRSR